MDDQYAYVGGALLAAALALGIAILGFGMTVEEALSPALIAAAVAIAVVYLTD